MNVEKIEKDKWTNDRSGCDTPTGEEDNKKNDRYQPSDRESDNKDPDDSNDDENDNKIDGDKGNNNSNR